MRIISTLRRFGLALALLAVLFTSAIMAPASAEASASSCRYGSGGEFCFRVDGTGKYIRTATFSLNRGGRITNPYVTVIIKNNQGNEIARRYYNENKTWWFSRMISLKIDERFPDSARQICGQWRDASYYSEICHNLK